jgi:hypothetical protein
MLKSAAEECGEDVFRQGGFAVLGYPPEWSHTTAEFVSVLSQFSQKG